jgi:hypothetical protein
MTLNPEITFTQDGALKRTHREFVEKGLVEETKEAFGICFRASFKWLACKIEGLTFPYYADKLVSAYKKQLAYLEQPSDLLEMDISYASWVEAVRDQDVLFLNKWGSRDPYRLQCQAMRVPQLRGSMPLAGDFVCCFYGTQKPPSDRYWGHAVAYFGSGSARFFDANDGEYSFSSMATAAADIDKFINGYTSPSKNKIIVDRFIYQMSKL